MWRAERRGFTLIELIAGLALVGVVFTSMLLLIDGLRDARDRLLERARRDNAASNGAELLRLLVARAEIGDGVGGRFFGADDNAQFRTWCEVPGGWLERCAVRLLIEAVGDSSFVHADMSAGGRLTLVGVTGELHFRYFVDVAGRAQWVPALGGSTTLPSAVAIVAGRDTVVMAAGGRS